MLLSVLTRQSSLKAILIVNWVVKKTNQVSISEFETPSKEARPADQKIKGEFYWGYASGVVATKVPDWGEFVLAEHTQTFDKSDISYFFPLMKQCEDNLGFKPKQAALDAAFDAFYVYDYFYKTDSPEQFAAVPLVQKGGHKSRTFDDTDLPLCEADLAMPLKSTFIHKTSLVEHERGRYACPLKYPQQTAKGCPINHKNWTKGGCLSTMPTSIGARLRYQLDRHSDTYKAVYKQRTATERINSQAVELGIERPKLRNQASIANHNTLIYILINLRACKRVQVKLKQLTLSTS
jgi:hypothetical protein